MIKEFNLRERAEIVSLAQECSKTLSAQPLIDYFNKIHKIKFENNGLTICDNIINIHYPNCSDMMRNNLREMMLLCLNNCESDNNNFPKVDKKSWFYTNCKRQRKAEAKICQCCPFRKKIEEQE